jgi:hypothetical protein
MGAYHNSNLLLMMNLNSSRTFDSMVHKSMNNPPLPNATLPNKGNNHNNTVAGGISI